MSIDSLVLLMDLSWRLKAGPTSVCLQNCSQHANKAKQLDEENQTSEVNIRPTSPDNQPAVVPISGPEA